MNTALCRARPGSPNVSHVVGYSEQDDKSLKYSGHTGSFFRELFGKSSIRMQKDNEEGVSAPPPLGFQIHSPEATSGLGHQIQLYTARNRPTLHGTSSWLLCFKGHEVDYNTNSNLVNAISRLSDGSFSQGCKRITKKVDRQSILENHHIHLINDTCKITFIQKLKFSIHMVTWEVLGHPLRNHNGYKQL